MENPRDLADADLLHALQVRQLFINACQRRPIPNDIIWAIIHEIREARWEMALIREEIRRRGIRFNKRRSQVYYRWVPVKLPIETLGREGFIANP